MQKLSERRVFKTHEKLSFSGAALMMASQFKNQYK